LKICLQIQLPNLSLQRIKKNRAAYEGHFEVCKYLVEDLENKNPFHVNNGSTPLHLAALRGNIEIFQWIAHRVEDKSPAYDLFGHTPLDYAGGNYEICKAIIESGGDPYPTTNNGTSSLQILWPSQNIRTLAYDERLKMKRNVRRKVVFFYVTALGMREIDQFEI
jgi:ankyrin repeat protein